MQMTRVEEKPAGQGLPVEPGFETLAIEKRMIAIENFQRCFAIRPGDRLVMLLDRRLDPRVTHLIIGLARSRGVKAEIIVSDTTQHLSIPDHVKPMLERATFVVSTWYCSVMDPYCIALRREQGQRWVKITFFRNYDLLDTEQARFPVDLVGEIIRETASMYPKDRDFELAFSDGRGTDLVIDFTAKMRDNLLAPNRWRGQMTAEEPGAYVHYIPTHGPNLYDRSAVMNDENTQVAVNGVVYPQWAVGFEKPFEAPVGVVFEDDRVVEVRGDGESARILRGMLIGGQLIELGCGFNPKAPRRTIYPAGSNSPGALHFGIDMPEPSDYVRRMMPNWEEPPIHMDLVSFDNTVRAGDSTLVDAGFLTALKAGHIVEAANRYGDPVDLLEGWPA